MEQDKPIQLGRVLSHSSRLAIGAGLVLLFLAMLAGALSIPYFYESPSMWYKAGLDRVSLLTGKMLGLTAALFIFTQMLLVGRFKCLDRVFGLPKLIQLHRIMAWLIIATAVLHPVCVMYSDGMLTVPMQTRYWPEWVGVGLLLVLTAQFVASRWRLRLGLEYQKWLYIHRLLGFVIMGLTLVHLLNVSESFSAMGVPRILALASAGAVLICWLWIRTGWLRARNNPCKVVRKQTMGRDCVCIELEPASGHKISYVPGQFVFVSFSMAGIPRQAHPFTISSAPIASETIQLTIRGSGDWTRGISSGVSEGDQALIQGPFGRFGHLFLAQDKDLIMIAGGIGITPMLSMLRHMAQVADARSITLIWSNRGPQDLIFMKELEELKNRLPGLTHLPVFTREPSGDMPAARLNHELLETMLVEKNRDSAVFLCGPPGMISQLKITIGLLGFPPRSILFEEFGF
jgi:predicted ferric reductase